MSKHKKARLQAEKNFLEFIDVEFPYVPPKRKEHGYNPNKILVIADPHEPYGNKQVYDSCLKLHQDAGVLIVTGDLGDYYSKSRFPKSRHQSFKEEVRSVFLRMEWFSQHWKSVKILVGNHDDRPEKKIQSLLADHPDLLILTERNLLQYMSMFFDNVEIVGIQIDLLGIGEIHTKLISHIYQYGDIIFTHAEKSNANHETLMQNISKYLRNWTNFLGLKPYTFIVQAHNHSEMRKTSGTERWFLTPTASYPKSIGFEYILHPKMFGSPPTVGYAVFHQYNGKTNYNESYNWIVE